ncbi:unnamed protein product [Prorocentrum cordatum]|uniref:Uncharacterized protein n=1 Tax=Prorocentrum cordatum TaxID=2364126 RepID=A0ABN9Q133_9DINO|nr:unnamed protein product [Polarella glacialis]
MVAEVAGAGCAAARNRRDEEWRARPGDAAVGEGRSESGTSTPAPVASESRSEASNAAPPEPQEDLRSALVGLADAELKEMGRRLAQSRVGLEEALEVELDEGRALKDENDYLKQTIDFMFSELGKLNIKGTNLTDPQLAEGPLDFVGRYWEKVRPRNNTVVVSEHVGEIDHTKKPQAGQRSERRKEGQPSL